MTLTPAQLVERGSLLFNKRKAVTTLWQEIAEHFYPQRADFTLTRYIGEEFAEQLFTSYPLLVHRELSNSIAAMLRPRRKDWFEISVDEFERLSKGAKEWLEWATQRMKRAMYDRKAHFIRATTEGDADFTAFGQCCLTREMNWAARSPHLLYRCWHLRDVAWAEMAGGSIGEIYIKWKPTIRQLKQQFGDDRLHQAMLSNVNNKQGGDLQEVQCMRLAVSTDIYQGQQGQFAPGINGNPIMQQHGSGIDWVIVYLDVVNKHIIYEMGVPSHGIVLPRWQTVSGHQYAYSPATVAGLPDARLLQAMTLTLLEAGEVSVRPPMIATQDAIRSDIQLFSGGITWADVEYDERKGDVLRPINQDRRGLPMGYEQHDKQQAILADAFYLNKLTLPPPEGDMTAFEVGQRVEEYVRAALPLFEPMEHEYNGQLCEDTFDALLRVGHFGPVNDIPQELRGRDVHFKFISPLHDAIERKNASEFLESADLIQRAIELDPNAVMAMDVGSALRSALEGVGLAEKHIRSERQLEQMVADAEEAQQLAAAAHVAQQAGKGARDFAQAGATEAESGGALI
jgi:hypothetical protein